MREALRHQPFLLLLSPPTFTAALVSHPAATVTVPPVQSGHNEIRVFYSKTPAYLG